MQNLLRIYSINTRQTKEQQNTQYMMTLKFVKEKITFQKKGYAMKDCKKRLYQHFSKSIHLRL